MNLFVRNGFRFDVKAFYDEIDWALFFTFGNLVAIIKWLEDFPYVALWKDRHYFHYFSETDW